MSVLTYIKQADEESRRLLREWLNSGHGHSTMSPEYFTSRGLPTDFVNDRCGRNWSNFTFVPRDCLKVSVSAGHEAPIGYSTPMVTTTNGGSSFVHRTQREGHYMLMHTQGAVMTMCISVSKSGPSSSRSCLPMFRRSMVV